MKSRWITLCFACVATLLAGCDGGRTSTKGGYGYHEVGLCSYMGGCMPDSGDEE